jgi:arginine-tRNA-protein transferase
LKIDTRSWDPIQNFLPAQTPLQIMREKLESLQAILLPSNAAIKVVQYEFFNANLITELKGADLFDFPVFLYHSEQGADNTPIVVFDIRDSSYHLLQCFSVYTLNPASDISGFYSEYLLKVEKDLYTTPVAKDMAQLLTHSFKNSGQ